MAESVEVIKIAGSCQPREPTFSHGPPEEQEFPQEEPQPMSPAEKDEARVLKRRIGKYKSLFPQETLEVEIGALDGLDIESLCDKAKDVEY